MRQRVSFSRLKLTDHCQLLRHRRGNDGGQRTGQGDVDFPFWGEKLIAPLLAHTKMGRNFLLYIAALAKEQMHSTTNWYTVHFCTKWTLYLVLIMLWGAKMQNFRLPKVLALPYSREWWVGSKFALARWK